MDARFISLFVFLDEYLIIYDIIYLLLSRNVQCRYASYLVCKSLSPNDSFFTVAVEFYDSLLLTASASRLIGLPEVWTMLLSLHMNTRANWASTS